MENQTVIQKKSPLKWILGILAAIIICLGAGSAFWYSTGDITGTWRSAALEKDLLETLTKESGDFSNLGLKASDLFKDAKVTLTVKDNKADFIVSYKVDSAAFGAAYSKLVEKEYQTILVDAEKTASEYGVTKEEVLKQVYGNDYEKAIKALFLTEDKAIEEFNKSISENATKGGANFDSKTGLVTANSSAGKVNPFLRVITGSTDGKKIGLENFSFSHYKRSGKTLTFTGEKNMAFTLEK
ncbi:hypothetical protein K6V78_04810 [Streptococcus gallolyticus]|uniref:hypothetical protein n=1 Tax=Streptococcus hepaticus TaxID=3349163 RepID=UPI001C98687A|nr:hypothetical protein [Streptococcus gallolyticus]MBY5040954.1 hypothetical protein [Streptococcus gallolyticus]